MKFCQPHWNALRDAIERRGLSHLIAKSGEDAAKRAVAELKGTATDHTLDPLMAAHWMIVGKVTERVGLALYGGDFCPVCEGIKTNEGVVDPKLDRVYTPEEEESYWIDGPADAVLQECRDKGLVLAQ